MPHSTCRISRWTIYYVHMQLFFCVNCRSKAYWLLSMICDDNDGYKGMTGHWAMWQFFSFMIWPNTVRISLIELSRKEVPLPNCLNMSSRHDHTCPHKAVTVPWSSQTPASVIHSLASCRTSSCRLNMSILYIYISSWTFRGPRSKCVWRNMVIIWLLIYWSNFIWVL